MSDGISNDEFRNRIRPLPQLVAAHVSTLADKCTRREGSQLSMLMLTSVAFLASLGGPDQMSSALALIQNLDQCVEVFDCLMGEGFPCSGQLRKKIAAWGPIPEAISASEVDGNRWGYTRILSAVEAGTGIRVSPFFLINESGELSKVI